MNNNTKRILGFTALMLATFLGTIDTTIVNIALPNITNYFKASVNDVSWISTIYVLSLSVFMITMSKLADQFGRKKMLIIGLIVFGLSSALCGLSKSLIFLIIVRFTQGIGAAIITPVGLPMGLEILGKEKRQFVVAVAGAIISVAAASGPPLGGVLVQYLNWQSIFFVNVPLCLISVILTILFVKESYDNTSSKSIDLLGMTLLTISLFSLTFALLKGNDFGCNSVFIISTFICSAVGTALFIFIEHKTKHPMLELQLFKEYTFAASCICYMMVGFGITSTMLIFNYFLEDLLGYTIIKAAFIIITISITSTVSVPLGSIIAKKIGTRPVNFFGIFFMGLGVFMLSELNINATKTEMVFSLIVFGVGLGFAGQAIASSIKYLPQEKSGIASGVINAFRQIGTCIGIAILVSMLNANVTKAINNVKIDAIANIKDQTTITKPIKTQLISAINNLNGKSSLSQTQIQTMIKNQSQKYINSLPVKGKQTAIKKIAIEKKTIINIIKTVISDKNKKITNAFSNTFLFSAILIMFMSIAGIFSDKKNSKVNL